MWKTQIGGATGMNILHSTAAFGECNWEQRCVVGNGIKQKAAKNTADSKSSKKRSRLNGNRL
jgi:hypothetical protein